MNRRSLSGLLSVTAFTSLVAAFLIEASVLFPWFLAVGVALVVSAIVTWRVPKNLIGWLLMAFAAPASVGGALVSIAAASHDPVTAGWFDAFGNSIITAGVLALPLTLLRFPDGNPLSGRWRPVEWLIAIAAPLGASASLLNGGWGGDRDQALGIPPFREATHPIGEVMSSIFFPMLLLVFLLAAASVIVRYRQSTGDGRLQLKWLAYSGGFVGVVAVVEVATGAIDSTGATGWAALMLAVAFASIPAAIGIAVLRYRLYDIDVVISKTLVFGALAILIAGLYVGIVVGLGSMLGLHRPGDGPAALLGLAAIVIIPIVFQPARHHLEHWANRVVFGRSATPYEVLSTFSSRVAAIDPGVFDQIARSLAEGTTAEGATIWSGSGPDRRLVSAWPGNADEPGPQRIRSTPIAHDGELLGEVALTLAPGQTLLPADERLLAQVASGLGLALRNLALTEALKDRVDQLRESRSRIVTVQDRTRRRLERDLHDGAQQRLVALKIKLGLASAVARKESGDAFDDLLEELRDHADRVIDTVRDFARGIYPPLLEAEGLPAALTAYFAKAPRSVNLETTAVGRYSKETEAAIYFCVLLGIDDAIRRGAGSIQVVLHEDDGTLVFEMSDDGRAVDDDASDESTLSLANIVDRIEALGGSVDISSRPGRGASIVGRLAVDEVIPA